MKLRKTPVQGQGFVRPENQSQQNFCEIIPVSSGVIGGRETNIVSARALHKVLGVKRDFTTWIKGRIDEYGFKKGVDFEFVENLTSPNPVSAKSRQRVEHDYLSTINMAKELAMVERTEQGRAVRQYFIKCEEELHKVTDDDIKQRVQDAAGELGWEAHFLDDGAICLEDDEGQHYFEQYNLRGNARLAIRMLRCELCYVAGDYPDELESWSEAGLNALAEWEKTGH
ncbi:antA/AntB antirepressor family protein [Escherichia coli]|uniref:antA/AntB antirepressor family protein n=1 Tax=Escherichia coli TaxID=562 RepID=UPI00093487B8